MKKQMMYYSLTILMIISIIGIVSAGVSITPSSINLGIVYPGETHSVNLTITADDIYLLVLNSTDPGITITPQNITTINGIMNATINITFAGDISSGIHNFKIGDNSIAVEIPSESPSPSHGHYSSYNPSNNNVTNQTNQTICSANEQQCVNDGIYKCNLNGQGWIFEKSCLYGCNGNVCKEAIVITPKPIEMSLTVKILLIIAGGLLVIIIIWILSKLR